MSGKISNIIKGIKRTYRFISTHPLTRDHKVSAIIRIIRWQVISRFNSGSTVFRFLENTKLIVERGMTGATGNLYAGLHDFEDMAFLLHFLRKDDLFGDIGANIGAYTVLASGVVRAKSVSVEPIPSTFNSLRRNIYENHLNDLVEIFNKGLGLAQGSLRFTNHLDTINHVIDGKSSIEGTIEVQIETLDILFKSLNPILLKIDVEGFEWNVLQGGSSVLLNPSLQAIIIELNELGSRYGISDETIHNLLLSYQFMPYSYSPFERKLLGKHKLSGHGNTIYIKNKEFVEQRITTSRKFTILGKVF